MTRGLAGIKFSTSPSKLGSRRIIRPRARTIIITPIKSLMEKNGWNGILSRLEFRPRGLFDPVWWRKIRWIITIAAIINGKTK